MDKETFSHIIKSVCKTNALGNIPYSFTYKKTVKKSDEGKTLLEFYSNAFPYKSINFWKDKISNNHILVNNKKAKPEFILKAGWITQHTTQDKTEPDVNTNIKLLYQDNDILVINKPAPLPVHASGRFYKNTLIHILSLAFPNETFKIVHRLDANTTGILVLAKNKVTADNLTTQFQNKSVKKQYLAWIKGELNSNITDIQLNIGKAKAKAGSRLLSSNGQKAETQLKLLKKEKEKSLVLLEPKDGRTNQLRIHLASIGHPIIGDLGYEDKNYFNHNPMTYPKDTLMLHAWKLTINYKGKQLDLEAPIPKKFGINKKFYFDKA